MPKPRPCLGPTLHSQGLFLPFPFFLSFFFFSHLLLFIMVKKYWCTFQLLINLYFYFYILSTISVSFLVYFYFLLCYCSFFFPFLSPHVACGILVHEPGVGLKLLWWELWIRTTGLTENLRPQGIFIEMRSHGGPHLSTKTQLYPTANKLKCWKSLAKQPVRQEHNPTLKKKKWDDKKICHRWRSKVKTYKTK